MRCFGDLGKHTAHVVHERFVRVEPVVNHVQHDVDHLMPERVMHEAGRAGSPDDDSGVLGVKEPHAVGGLPLGGGQDDDLDRMPQHLEGLGDTLHKDAPGLQEWLLDRFL